MGKPKYHLELCKSCLKDCGFKPKKFRKALRHELEEATGENFEVETASCLKVCPRDQIAFSVGHKRTMTRSPDLESVIDETLSRLGLSSPEI